MQIRTINVGLCFLQDLFKKNVMKIAKTFSGADLRELCIILLVLFSTQILSAQWHPNLPYRAPITVTNSLTSVLTDYQVKVNLGTSGPWSTFANDGSDLRFTASDGITEIPYWIESWNYGTSAVIWVKVPSVAASPATTTIYMYYGAESTSYTIQVSTPPSGPFTKSADNPIIPIGVPATGATSLLAENIVYDPVTQHYWMVLTNQTSGAAVCLVYSDDPTNPDAWHWSGTVIPNAIAPHLMEYNGTWYIFYGDRSGRTPLSDFSSDILFRQRAVHQSSYGSACRAQWFMGGFSC